MFVFKLFISVLMRADILVIIYIIAANIVTQKLYVFSTVKLSDNLSFNITPVLIDLNQGVYYKPQQTLHLNAYNLEWLLLFPMLFL